MSICPLRIRSLCREDSYRECAVASCSANSDVDFLNRLWIETARILLVSYQQLARVFPPYPRACLRDCVIRRTFISFHFCTLIKILPKTKPRTVPEPKPKPATSDETSKGISIPCVPKSLPLFVVRWSEFKTLCRVEGSSYFCLNYFLIMVNLIPSIEQMLPSTSVISLFESQPQDIACCCTFRCTSSWHMHHCEGGAGDVFPPVA